MARTGRQLEHEVCAAQFEESLKVVNANDEEWFDADGSKGVGLLVSRTVDLGGGLLQWILSPLSGTLHT